jgi:hypothetical protein
MEFLSFPKGSPQRAEAVNCQAKELGVYALSPLIGSFAPLFFLRVFLGSASFFGFSL